VRGGEFRDPVAHAALIDLLFSGLGEMHMTYRIRSAIAVVAVALGFFGATRSAGAAEVYNSGGFEAPRFTTAGDPELAGQDTQGPWLKDGGTGSAVVQTAVVRDGSQAVRFQRPANAGGDTRYGVIKPLAPVPLNLLRVSWDMNVTQTQLSGVDFGPVFGVEGYDAFNPTAVKLIGSLTVDSTTGDVLVQDEDGFFAETGEVVPFGQWNRFLLEMDYATQMYTAYVNGAPVATSPFVDPGILGFTDAPLAALAATGATIGTAAGTAYFDNYSIEIVPEPGSLALVGLVSLGLLRRRRTA
jgi:hypothetical protein